MAPEAVPADPVDELPGRFTTGSSRLFIRAAGLIFGDGNTYDAGEFGGESTSIGVGVTGALCRKTDPKIATVPQTQSRSKDQNKDKDNSK